MPIDETEHIEVEGTRIAFRRTTGRGDLSTLVWLGGFHSDMQGEKASSLHYYAQREGRAFVRFDYSGHGESGGKFEEGTIGLWRANALAVLDKLTAGPLVLIGSSMGGWMALLCALARPSRVKALILSAPAPDFTDKLMWARFTDDMKKDVMEKGSWTRPSAYDADGYPITRALIEEGRAWNILDNEIPIDVPVRILHGGLDEDVPWTHSLELAGRLKSEDVVWTLIKDGDHRLSRLQDIERLVDVVMRTADQVDEV